MWTFIEPSTSEILITFYRGVIYYNDHTNHTTNLCIDEKDKIYEDNK